MRLKNFALISCRVSCGVAEGPGYMPRYFPLVCVVSMPSQDKAARRDISVEERGELGMCKVLCRLR